MKKEKEENYEDCKRGERIGNLEWRGQNKDQDVTDVEEKEETTKCK